MLFGFALLVACGLLLESGISGRPIGDVVRGTIGSVTGTRAVGFVDKPSGAVAAATSAVSNIVGGVAGTVGGAILEVFHDPLGYYFDSGKVVQGAIGGHGGHVHLAAGPTAVQKWAKIANKQFRLTIRELEPWDPVDPVHTEDSFHYSKRAFDATGSSSDMRAFAEYAIRQASRGKA